MIWVFDSWFGGLQTLKYLKNYFQNENFVFLADNKNLPYWEKTKEQIEQFSTRCINWLFEYGCDVVVIACNTAVAWLYENWDYHNRNWDLIWVTYAGLHEVIRLSYKNIWVLATQTTTDLWIYPKIYEILWWNWNLEVVACPKLVPMIENWETNENKIILTIRECVSKFNKNIDCLVLWCTHYPVYINYFWELYPKCKIVDPWRYSVIWLENYFKKYPDKQDNVIDRKIEIFCTWNVDIFKKNWQRLWRQSLSVKQINL